MTVAEATPPAIPDTLSGLPHSGATMPPRAPRLTDQELAEAGPPEAVRLPLELVDENPRNPRKSLAEIQLLAENIRVLGLQQPVTVRRAGERYELLGGHRRRAAFLYLREMWPMMPEWRTIPAVVKSADDDQSYLMLISAQVHNLNWKPREEAAALERLVIDGRTPIQVGEALNRTKAWASKRLRVYSDSVLSGFVQAGKIPPSVAEELLVVLDPKLRQELAERAADEGWGQDYARGEVRLLRKDRQLAEVGRQARALLDLLSSISDVSLLPPGATDDLWKLRGRIITLGRGGPIIPTLEQAPGSPRPRQGRPRKAGYRPRL